MSKKRHLRRLSRLALAVCCLFSLLPAAQVAAVPFDDVGGDPGGGGGASPDPGYSTYRNVCYQGAGWRESYDPARRVWVRDLKIWDAPYSGCVANICPSDPPNQAMGTCTLARTAAGGGPGSIDPCPQPVSVGASIPPCRRLTGADEKAMYKVCQTHWEVWRFYGTKADPVKAWSFSRINLRDWCSDEQAPMRTFSPHPHDAGFFQPASNSNPFVRVAFTSPKGEPVHVSQASDTDPTGRYTTTNPIRSSGRCTVLNSPNSPYGAGADWAKSNLMNLYNFWKPTFSESTARAMANMSSSLAWNDSIPCSSGTEFAPTADVVKNSPQQYPVFGSCWVQVKRRAGVFTGPTGPAILNWPASSIHRYDPYSPQHGSSVNNKWFQLEASGGHTPRIGSEPAHYKKWRDTIADEVASRTGPRGKPADSNRSNMMWLPGEPYTSANTFSTSVNLLGAASAAAYGSVCVDGPLSDISRDTPPPPVPDTPTTPDPVSRPNGPSILYTLTAPRNFLTAGAPIRQQVIGSATDFLCNDCTVDSSAPRPILTRLVMDVSVVGSGNFRQFRDVGSPVRLNLATSCSVSRLSASFNPSNPSASCGQTRAFEFYRATNPTQSVNLAITGSGTVTTFPTKRWISTFSSRNCDPARRGCVIQYWYYEPVDKSITIIPRLKIQDASTITSGSSMRVPVLSSTAVWR